jgi:signal peptidase II
MQTPRRKGLAVADRPSHLRLWLTLAVGAAVDLGTKYWAWAALGGPLDEGGRQVDVIDGWLRFVDTRNPGIVFGINFADYPALGPTGGRILTIGLAFLTAALIFYVFAASRLVQRWLHIACGLVLAGAAGNLYDRIGFGYVRDLIQFTGQIDIAGHHFSWPYIFNVADVYLVVGVAVLAIYFLLAPGSKREGAAKKKDGAEA